jgi:hypothetical protein
MLKSYSQNRESFIKDVDHSKVLAKLSLNKNPSYLDLKVHFIDKFSECHLPIVVTLLDICKQAEPLVAYSIQHPILFAIGLSSVMKLYVFIYESGGAISILKEIVYNIEMKKPLSLL